MPGQIPVRVTVMYPPERGREHFVMRLHLNELSLMDLDAYWKLSDDVRAKRSQPNSYGFIIGEIKAARRARKLPDPRGYIDISWISIERLDTKSAQPNG